ncbi:MAG: hypothetical protein ACI83Y_000299 [Candidatus Azotimanducaceae bacterium]|jgi:hypothetical protein
MVCQVASVMVKRWLDFLGDADQVVLALRPTWAVAFDMAAISSFIGDVG